MRVDEVDPVALTVRIPEITHLLTGLGRLSVTSTGETTSCLEWVEDSRVPGVPQFLVKSVPAAGRRGFQTSIHGFRHCP